MGSPPIDARYAYEPATSNLQPETPNPESLIEPLSERELEAQHLLAEGRTYQEIGQAMYVSVNTVKTHLRNVYAKLRVHTRRKAVARARELGLVG